MHYTENALREAESIIICCGMRYGKRLLNCVEPNANAKLWKGGKKVVLGNPICNKPCRALFIVWD